MTFWKEEGFTPEFSLRRGPFNRVVGRNGGTNSRDCEVRSAFPFVCESLLHIFESLIKRFHHFVKTRCELKVFSEDCTGIEVSSLLVYLPRYLDQETAK